jgi:hypothetical protein
VAITVNDNVAPTWVTAPGSLNATFTCNADVVVPPVPVATDNCPMNTATVSQLSDVTTPSGVCDDQYVRVITYLATDECGNVSLPFTVTITVNDNVAPTWVTVPGSLNVTFTCNADVVVPPVPVATDNCPMNTATVSVLSDVTTPSGVCDDQYVRVITYVATDECGNVSLPFTVTITVNDNVAPTWVTVPGSLNATFTCNADVVVPPVPVATDNCPMNTATVTVLSDVTTPSGVCDDQYVRVITYVATDECGNVSLPFTVTITVNDNVAPTWVTVPGSLNATFTCNADVVVPPVPVATDNCPMNTATVTVLSDVTTPSGVCDDQYVRVITYVATDECGNVSLPFTVTITVNDNVAPTWVTVPGSLNATFTCNADVVVPPVPVATDNCPQNTATVTILSDETFPSGPCDDQYLRVITYVATDECGNVSLPFTVSITVFDNVGPTWVTVPGSLNANFTCNASVVVPPAPTAIDNCPMNTATVMVQSDVTTPSGVCDDQYVRVITYVAVDECGNVSVPFTVTITINDNVAPTWVTVPGSLNANFTCNASVIVPPAPVAIDNCPMNMATVSVLSDVTTPSGVCDDQYVRVITYVATDECGNVSLPYTVTITVNDNVAPTWVTVPGSLDATFTCSSDVVVPPAPIATDNCPMNTATVMVQSDVTTPSGVCDNQYVRVITYVATDECGNVSLPFTVTITVNDNVAPTWDVNACENIGMETVNANADCEAVMPDLRADALLQLTENCDVLTVADIIQVPAPGSPLVPPVGFDGCGPTGAVVYAVDVTFNVMDLCGNPALELSCDDLVKVQDVTAPTWNVDACDNIGMETVNANADCEAVMPDLRADALAQLTENCDVLTVADILQVPAPGSPLAPPVGFDGCGPTGPVVYTVDVTFNVTDCNGNAAVELACADLVKVQDVTAPTWNVDACDNIGMETVNANADCEAVMPDLRADALAQLTENCDVLTVADILQVPAPGSPLAPPVGFDGCGPTGPVVYTVDVTFNVTDCNGNAAVELACADLVKVQDVTAPTWNVDACDNIGMETVNANADCEAVMPDLRADALAQLTENCDVLTVADILQVPAPGSPLAPPVGFDGCGPTGPVVYTVDVTFNVTDCNGNAAVELACADLVKVQDVTAPTWDVDACENIGMEIVNANADCEAVMPDLRADALAQLTENCDVLTVADILQVPAPGSPLAPPVGFDGCGPTGPVVYTVDVTFNVTDCNGNAAVELACADLVKVQDVTAPTWNVDACDNIGMETVNANADCEAVMPDLRADALAQLTENCDVLTVADILQVPAPGSPLAPPVGFDGCGPTGPVVYTVDVTFNVTDCNGNAAVELACADLVKVQDVTAPTWNVDACDNIGMETVNANADCEAVMPDLRADALAQLTENCDVLTVADILQVPAPGSPLAPPVGFDGCGPTGPVVYTVDVTFNVTDCNGNAAVELACADLVKVQDVTAPTWNVDACDNIGMETVNANADCEAVMPDLRADALAQLTENCDVLTVADILQVPAPGSPLAPPVGFDGCGPTGPVVYTVDVTFNVTDCNGNAAVELACADLVKVQDVTAPTWNVDACDNIGMETVNANADCEAVMPDLRADALAQLTENCDVLTVADILQVPAPGSPLAPPVGFDGCGPTGPVVYTVDVTFNVTDCNGNAAVELACADLVKVQDVTAPTWNVDACDNIGMETVNANADCEAVMPI